jgi:hypothetical protein
MARGLWWKPHRARDADDQDNILKDSVTTWVPFELNGETDASGWLAYACQCKRARRDEAGFGTKSRLLLAQ